ncbi:hypothetical protein NKH77_17635 [Streptomyces sp. M19]
MTQQTGQIPDVQVSWTTNCSATCAPGTTKPWTSTSIAYGQNLKDTYTLKDSATSTTAYDYLDLDYALTITSPDATQLTPPITWEASKSAATSTSRSAAAGVRGAVVHPTLRLQRAQYGSSADMVDWAQRNLSGHWGLRGTGEPLHRLQKRSQQESNRTAICGTTKFDKDPNIPDDTCDEFPFAGVYESAALNGVDHGKDCAQVTAVKAGSTGDLAVDWPTITPLGTFTGSEKCVRGHIPRSLNTDLGGDYGRFIQNQRLADDEAFWLSVVL